VSKEHCTYHPAKPAVWRCEHCRVEKCTDCVPGSRENYDGCLPRCILCNTELKYLGAANLAEPFWTQAGLFFAYPLKTSGLATLAFMTVLSALLPPNVIGVLGALFIAALTVHCGLRIIDRVSDGDMSPPPLAELFKLDGEHLFLKQIAVLVLLAIFIAAAGYLGALIGGAVTVFVLLAIPASTMLLATTTSVMEAVNPRNLVLLMLRIGPTYLLLWFCLMVVAAGPTLVMPMLAELLPAQALLPAFTFVSAYFTFVTYAMMGYILYEKQAELGFASNRDFGETLDYKPFMTRRALAHARILASANRQAQALDILRIAVGVDEANPELRELYFRIVSTTGDEEAIRRNTNSVCEFFIARQTPARAATFCLETRKRYPDFVPADSVACHRIAEQLFEQRKFQDAAALLLSLHRNAPMYPDMVNAVILMARIFFEGLNAKEKAIALLQQVRARHPGHPETPRIDRLLEVMTYDGPATA
jgi:hypothetical protein